MNRIKPRKTRILLYLNVYARDSAKIRLKLAKMRGLMKRMG